MLIYKAISDGCIEESIILVFIRQKPWWLFLVTLLVSYMLVSYCPDLQYNIVNVIGNVILRYKILE